MDPIEPKFQHKHFGVGENFCPQMSCVSGVVSYFNHFSESKMNQRAIVKQKYCTVSNF